MPEDDYDVVLRQVTLDAEHDAGMTLQDMVWQLRHGRDVAELRRVMRDQALVALLVEAALLRARTTLDADRY